MMKQNDSFAEPRFPVRSYGKGELAMYYLPGIAQQTAVNQLNENARKHIMESGLKHQAEENFLKRLREEAGQPEEPSGKDRWF